MRQRILPLAVTIRMTGILRNGESSAFFAFGVRRWGRERIKFSNNLNEKKITLSNAFTVNYLVMRVYN